MIKAVFTFALEGIKGREVYWPKAKDLKLAEIAAVSQWEEQLIQAGLPTFECDCCIDAEAAKLELYSIELFAGSTCVMSYPVDIVSEPA